MTMYWLYGYLQDDSLVYNKPISQLSILGLKWPKLVIILLKHKCLLSDIFKNIDLENQISPSCGLDEIP